MAIVKLNHSLFENISSVSLTSGRHIIKINLVSYKANVWLIMLGQVRM